MRDQLHLGTGGAAASSSAPSLGEDLCAGSPKLSELLNSLWGADSVHPRLRAGVVDAGTMSHVAIEVEARAEPGVEVASQNRRSLGVITLSLALVLHCTRVVRVECMRRIISIESLCISSLDYEPRI